MCGLRWDGAILQPLLRFTEKLFTLPNLNWNHSTNDSKHVRMPSSFHILFHASVYVSIKQFQLPFYCFRSFSSLLGTILLQNQCFCHSSIISSIATRLLSQVETEGIQKSSLLWSIQRKTGKFQTGARITVRETLCDHEGEEQVHCNRNALPCRPCLQWNISLGTVHPRGPHDHPNAATNKHIVVFLE